MPGSLSDYLRLLLKAGFDGLVAEVLVGGEDFPFPWVHVPDTTYNFLPAMVPLWTEDAKTVGFWIHWPIPEREPVLGVLDPECDYAFTPLASDFYQLLVAYVFKGIVLTEGLRPGLEGMISKLGIGRSDVNRMLDLAQEGDFDLDIFPELACTKSRPDRHRSIFEDFGDAFVCSVEIDEDQRAEARKMGAFWFQREQTQRHFERFLEHGKLKQAWLALNSNGWTFSQAQSALKRLAAKIDEPLFYDLTKAWCACRHDRYGGGY